MDMTKVSALEISKILFWAIFALLLVDGTSQILGIHYSVI